ncbi:MAG: hypothetical protein PWP23_2104 [Candidatus Sumerlaeota bacterium]|nr:hypothetical protein [Candidatus Sumerlaeota bacterium]
MIADDAIARLHEVLAGRRVALVHDWLNGMRGGEKVLEQFCHLFPDADIFTLFYEPGRISPLIRRHRVIEHPLPRRFPVLRQHYRYLLPFFPRMVRTFPTHEYDLVLSTSHCVAKGARPPRRGPHLSYVFTPMRYAWDHFEDYLTGRAAQDMGLRLVRPWLQRWDAESARHVDSFAADSHHIAAKAKRFWGRRARVIHPPVDLDFHTPGDKEPGDYFLCVGAFVPYKRFDRAIQAAKLAGRRLIVVGAGPERERLEALAGDGVEFRGWASNEELRRLYRGCQALIYPGVEDFGITALEVQACGRPVLALHQGGAVETVVAGVTGEFFEEPTPGALADLLTAFRPESYTPTVIRAQAERFSAGRFRQEVACWILSETMPRGWGPGPTGRSSSFSSS